MAEERLIDEDKDRKYKIRKNADGEDELYIDESEEEEQSNENIDIFFDVDDETAVMTSEQLAERERLLQAEKERVELQASTFLDRAEKLLAENDFAGAESSIVQAEDLTTTNGRLYILKCRVLSRNFTDFTRLEECASAAKRVEMFASENERKEILPLLKQVKLNLDEAKTESEELFEKNELQKNVRREFFKKSKKSSGLMLAAIEVPFVLCLALMIYFIAIRNSDLSGLYMNMAIGFAVATGVIFVVSLFFIRRFWAESRKLKLNERNSATKLGREYEQAQKKFDEYTQIYRAFSGEV